MNGQIGSHVKKSSRCFLTIYQHDLHADNSHGFTASASDQLVQKRNIVGTRHDCGADSRALANEEQEITGSERQAYGQFWLDLQKETLSDEAYLHICRETGLTSELIDRLLTLGRIDEAERATQPIDDLGSWDWPTSSCSIDRIPWPSA